MRVKPALLESVSGQPMALESVTAHGMVRGLLFELTVEQRYRNPGANNIEVVYTFPLPIEAVLLDLDVRLGERKLSAVVVERKEAEGRYEKAIDHGDTAIMLERAGSGLFTLNLGNLMAGEIAVIRYRYAQLLRFAHGSARLAVPTVIAPRYGDPGQAGLEPHQIPMTDLVVEYPFALTLDLQGDIAAGTLSSPSHPIATTHTQDGVRVSLAKGAFLDRDFVLNVGKLTGRSLVVIAQDGERFVALASFCAEVPRDADELPLRVKLLVDCSGSMTGDSIEAARRALHRILAGLTAADQFSFSRFGTTVVHKTAGLVPADAAHICAASQHLDRMAADLGGTKMPEALRSVFELGTTDAAADVLLITDGEVWDAEGLLADAIAGRQRVFVVGIGSAPAEGVLKCLAQASGGVCEFVAPSEDAEGAILRMFARLRAPRVERAEITWAQTPAWATPLPSALFGSETVHVFAGFAAEPTGAATLKLWPRGEGAPMHAEAQLPTTCVADPTLARVAAAHRIETAVEAEQLQLALDYGLLTSRTNLLVVAERADGEKAKDLPELARIAQMHAAGWHGVGSVMGSVSCRMDVSATLESLNCVGVPPTAIDLPAVARRKSPRAISSPDERALPEFLRRSPDRAESSSDAGFGVCALPDFLRTVERKPRKPVSSVVAFLVGIERAGSEHSPATLEALAGAGLPSDLQGLLADLVAGGHDERDVVRALLEAFGEMLADRTIEARTSRQFARTLRRQFGSATEQRELRDRVGTMVRNSGGIARKFQTLAPDEMLGRG